MIRNADHASKSPPNLLPYENVTLQFQFFEKIRAWQFFRSLKECLDAIKCDMLALNCVNRFNLIINAVSQRINPSSINNSGESEVAELVRSIAKIAHTNCLKRSENNYHKLDVILNCLTYFEMNQGILDANRIEDPYLVLQNVNGTFILSIKYFLVLNSNVLVQNFLNAQNLDTVGELRVSSCNLVDLDASNDLFGMLKTLEKIHLYTGVNYTRILDSFIENSREECAAAKREPCKAFFPLLANVNTVVSTNLLVDSIISAFVKTECEMPSDNLVTVKIRASEDQLILPAAQHLVLELRNTLPGLRDIASFEAKLNLKSSLTSFIEQLRSKLESSLLKCDALIARFELLDLIENIKSALLANSEPVTYKFSIEQPTITPTPVRSRHAAVPATPSASRISFSPVFDIPSQRKNRRRSISYAEDLPIATPVKADDGYRNSVQVLSSHAFNLDGFNILFIGRSNSSTLQEGLSLASLVEILGVPNQQIENLSFNPKQVDNKILSRLRAYDFFVISDYLEEEYVDCLRVNHLKNTLKAPNLLLIATFVRKILDLEDEDVFVDRVRTYYWYEDVQRLLDAGIDVTSFGKSLKYYFVELPPESIYFSELHLLTTAQRFEKQKSTYAICVLPLKSVESDQEFPMLEISSIAFNHFFENSSLKFIKTIDELETSAASSFVAIIFKGVEKLQCINTVDSVQPNTQRKILDQVAKSTQYFKNRNVNYVRYEWIEDSIIAGKLMCVNNYLLARDLTDNTWKCCNIKSQNK